MEQPHIVTNVYPWMTFYRRDNRDWNADVSAGLDEVLSTGVQGFEGMGDNPAQVQELGEQLTERGLEMRSLYVNSVLHDPNQAKTSIESVLAIAEVAHLHGCRILVTNPSPIRWGGPENKSDTELIEQAKNLDMLGQALGEMGIALAYHNHDVELRKGAREFHHMLNGTDPEWVKFCLDAHWVFRGCGDSEVALFDVVELYLERIVELHLRQSESGIWTEVFSMEGDIDYKRLFSRLDKAGLRPLLVLEQAVEKGSGTDHDAVSAHQQGVRALFDALEGLS